MLFKAHKEAIEHLKKERDEYKAKFEQVNEAFIDCDEKLLQIAKIAFKSGGIKGQAKIQQIKDIVYDWKEK
jgi:prefoldin subunit 5